MSAFDDAMGAAQSGTATPAPSAAPLDTTAFSAAMDNAGTEVGGDGLKPQQPSFLSILPSSIKSFILGGYGDPTKTDHTPTGSDVMEFARDVPANFASGGLKAQVLGGQIAHSLGLTSDENLKTVSDFANNYAQQVKDAQGDSMPAQAASMVGQGLASAPYAALTGGVSKLAPLVSDASTKVVPVLSSLAPDVGSLLPQAQGFVANKLVPAMAQGGTINAITGEGNGQTAGSNFGIGAAIGGAIPTVGKGVSIAKGVGNSLLDLVTPSGTDKIALDALHGFTGGPVPVNAAEIIPGSQPTLAEAAPAGNTAVANLQRTVQNSDPVINQQFNQRAAANMAARQSAFNDAAGSAEDIETGKLSKADLADTLLPKVFNNAAPVDTTPITNAIQATLADTGGKRPAVEATMNSVNDLISSVTNPDGTADPQTLYDSVRKGIGDMIDGKNFADPKGLQASRELLAVRDALDHTIEQGAPGFQNYLSKYSDASSNVDAMQKLQGLNLFDAKGNTTLNKVQGAINNLQKQQGMAGANAAKSVTSDQMDTLQAVRDDLLRGSQADAGRAAGSPTVQNLASDSLMKTLLPGKIAGVAGDHISPQLAGSFIGAKIGGPVGLFAGNVGGKLIQAGLAGKDQAVKNKLAQYLLNPADYQAAVNAQQVVRSPNLLSRLTQPYLPAAAAGGNQVLTYRNGQ